MLHPSLTYVCNTYLVVRVSWFGFMVFNATFNNILAIYRGSQFYWWRKPAYPEIPSDPSQVTDKLYHIMLYRPNWECGEVFHLNNRHICTIICV